MASLVPDDIIAKFEKLAAPRTHKRGFTSYHDTFRGDQTVAALVKDGLVADEKAAIKLAEDLMQMRYLTNVNGEQAKFENAKKFYRFSKSDKHVHSVTGMPHVFDCPVEKSWDIINRWAHIDDWYGDVVKVEVTSDIKSGVGAKRYLTFADGSNLREEVVRKDDNAGVLEFVMTDHGFPLSLLKGWWQFTSTPDGKKTSISATYTYATKGIMGGALGGIINSSLTDTATNLPVMLGDFCVSGVKALPSSTKNKNFRLSDEEKKEAEA